MQMTQPLTLHENIPRYGQVGSHPLEIHAGDSSNRSGKKKVELLTLKVIAIISLTQARRYLYVILESS